MGQTLSSLLKSYLPSRETGETPDAGDEHQGRRNSGNADPDPDPTDGATQGGQASAGLIPEALPNIRLLVNHELPNGSGNEHNITFHPYNLVSQLRATMEAFSGIPQDNIYFLFKTNTLDDSLSLFAQKVGAFDRITMRDNRLTYPYPY